MFKGIALLTLEHLGELSYIAAIVSFMYITSTRGSTERTTAAEQRSSWGKKKKTCAIFDLIYCSDFNGKHLSLPSYLSAFEL